MWFWIASALAADVAIVLDGGPESDRFSAPVAAEITGLVKRDAPTTETFYANYGSEGAERALTAALASDARVVVAIGPLVSEVVLGRGDSPKPTIAALSLSDTPAPANVTTLRLESSLEEPLLQLAHILGSDDVALALPPYLAPFARRVLGEERLVVLEPGAPPPDVHGVLVGPRDSLAQADQDALFERWTDAGVASLFLTAPSLPPHVMGIYQDDGAQHPISRRVALTTVQLLEGRTVRSGSVAARRGDLVLSAEVLDRLDLSLPFDVLADAEVVGWDDQFPTVSLQSQLAVAFENSPELASMRARVAGENTGVAGARASWLPQVEAQASASQLDQAAASAFQPPTNVTAKVTASQVLWSDGAATNVRVQGDLRTGRAAELVAAEQDLAHDISVAFVNVERARAVIAVRAADMDRARLSLQVANQRARIGDGAQSEVNRWEAEVANARAALVANWADFRAAMVNLNLLCGVEPERMIVPEPNGLTVGEEFASRLNNPRKLDRLAGLAADVGVERAPELDQLTSALQAQNRLKRLTDRAYAMPTVALQGGVNFNIYQTESDPIEIPGLGPIELATFPAAYWNVGAVASIPLFSGGQRRADQVKAGHDVASLEYQRRQIELAIRARAVTAVNQAHSAAWQAELRQDAAEAALKNLDAALSAYAAGSATQTTVTEARTNALQVQLAATDARFATTLRLLDLLRAGASLPTPAAPDGPTTMRSILIDRLESAP